MLSEILLSPETLSSSLNIIFELYAKFLSIVIFFILVWHRKSLLVFFRSCSLTSIISSFRHAFCFDKNIKGKKKSLLSPLWRHLRFPFLWLLIVLSSYSIVSSLFSFSHSAVEKHLPNQYSASLDETETWIQHNFEEQHIETINNIMSYFPLYLLILVQLGWMIISFSGWNTFLLSLWYFFLLASVLLFLGWTALFSHLELYYPWRLET